MTSAPHGLRSAANWIASLDPCKRDEFLDGLDPGALAALPYLFEFWAHEHQLPPAGDWRTWVCLGGRGAGKTRAGAEWVRSMVEGARPLDEGRARRVALVGETHDQIREVMVFGPSGIMAASPPDRRPDWQAGRRRLEWPNGAIATCHSAFDPEGLRGPQFDAAWVDELAKWKKADEAWDMLQFALRLGDHPQQVVTTTPRNVAVLKKILAAESTVVTRAPTEANRAHLALSFLEEVRTRYHGQRRAREELDGEFLASAEGALWTGEALEGLRVQDPEVARIVVAVDPPVTGHKGSDECGIIVAGAVTEGPPRDWRAYVLEDASVRGASPLGWATAAVEAAERHGADLIVAEVNQGGDMVKSTIRQINPFIRYRDVRATKGKAVRAEPVAALYEQGRIRHAGLFHTLEDQMCLMTAEGYQGRGSPDRLDALVWAMTELMLEPVARYMRAQIRTL